MAYFMISAYEKNLLLKDMGKISEMMFENPFLGEVFSKVLVNYVQKTTPSNNHVGDDLASVDTSNLDSMRMMLERALGHIITVATEDVEYGQFYTTGQLAKLFGVSITTINNWIKEGRFVGVERSEKFKQARISQSAYWRAQSGQLIQIKDVAAKFNNSQSPTPTKAQELKDIVDSIVFYEKKYGGSYEETLAKRPIETVDQERDAREWRYLLSILEGDDE